MGKDSVTYVTYSQGVDAKHISLGNLAHDPKNPKFYDPYVEKAYADISDEAPEWATSTPLENYALTVGQDSDKPEQFQVVAGTKATKLEIKDPSKFFTSTTLSTDASQEWLTLRLSANELSSSTTKPSIWLLTGLIVMQHATWTNISITPEQASSFTPGLPAPFNTPGISSLRKLSVSDRVRPVIGFKDDDNEKKERKIEGSQILETGKYPGSRVWAARWEKVDYVVKDGKDWKEDKGNLKLRLDEGVRKFAKVELKKGEYAGNKVDEESALDDKFWEEYLDGIADEEE